MATTEQGRKIDIGRVIGRGFEALGGNLLPFLALALMLGGLPALALYYAQATFGLDGGSPVRIWGGFTAALLVSIVAGNFTAAIFVRSTILYLNNGVADWRGSTIAALRLIVPMVLLSILVSIVITLGLLLLIVPGIIFALALIVAAPVLIAEQPGIIDSMHRSAELTRGSKGQIFLLVLIYIFAWFALSAVLGFAAGAGGLDDVQVAAAAAVSEGLLGAASTLITSVMTASLYVELRTVKEGATIDRLAAVFA
jgi:hypothetical protein